MMFCQHICTTNRPSGHRRPPYHCRYHQDKGFQVILVSRVLNVLALGFTIVFSAFLLLCVRWNAFHSKCIQEDTCDISEVYCLAHITLKRPCLSAVVGRADYPGKQHCT